ncbi:hypothetical protein [Streptomyces sp. Ac-502]|uniref:hypothetical protein n=1 Tax=Streptomyces sp. Ac-502 TaxID=3342801 RepID=UPI0038626D2E
MAARGSRFEPNPDMYRQFARSDEMYDVLFDAAQRGANAARVRAPTYSGPTWAPGVSRHGEYRASIYSAASLRPNGWRAEFGARAPWSLQVEFGSGVTRSGRPRRRGARPQHGHSPKWRTLGRALESLRSR